MKTERNAFEQMEKENTLNSFVEDLDCPGTYGLYDKDCPFETTGIKSNSCRKCWENALKHKYKEEE